MGLFDKIADTVFVLSTIIQPPDPKPLTDAQCDEINMKQQADKAAEMEYIFERETDPLISKKLEWRLNNRVYEWEDLYK